MRSHMTRFNCPFSLCWAFQAARANVKMSLNPQPLVLHNHKVSASREKTSPADVCKRLQYRIGRGYCCQVFPTADRHVAHVQAACERRRAPNSAATDVHFKPTLFRRSSLHRKQLKTAESVCRVSFLCFQIKPEGKRLSQSDFHVFVRAGNAPLLLCCCG